MPKRILICSLALAALAATPSAASAADLVVVPGATVRQMTALDGAVAWTTGTFPKQTLMLRNAEGVVGPVQGAPKASYPSIDFGHNAKGRLVLTYLRCEGTRNCVAISDDLAGHRSFYKRLVPKRCMLSAAPSRWNDRVAYGLACDKLTGKPNRHDAKRTGLYVRKGSAAPRRLRFPKDAIKFGVDRVSRVDLRGTIVGAAVTDIYSYAFAQTVNGSNLRTSFAAASEGDSDEHVVGQALGSGGVLWTLVDASHAGDPNQSRITRLRGGDCADSETVNSPEEQADYRYEALAVNRSTVYLYAPGTGIVVHPFSPTFTCP